MVLIASNGVHANGISLLRDIARRLEKGYETTLDDGTDLARQFLAVLHIRRSRDVAALVRCRASLCFEHNGPWVAQDHAGGPGAELCHERASAGAGVIQLHFGTGS